MMDTVRNVLNVGPGTFVFGFVLFLRIALSAVRAAEAAEGPAYARPNIVLVLVDDWGWNGTSIRMDKAMPNSKIPILEMPHLEQMAREGMIFRNAYSGAPQCAPSRVCIQTGQTTARSGYTVVLGNNDPDAYYDTRKQYMNYPLIHNVSDTELDRDAVTIPKALKPLGYVSAHVGKWHMGSDPGAAGYALHDGVTGNGEGNTVGKVDRIPDDFTDPKRMFSITQKAIGFMKEQVNAQHPFYLQISHYALHAGAECLPATREKIAGRPAMKALYASMNGDPDTIHRKKDPAVWLGMAEDLDGRIGAVLETIKALGIEDNTYVVMTSDNGYRHHFPGLKHPLHGGKWWVWQGGIRVPMIVKGPGIKPGSVFYGNVVNSDFLPTLVEWAGGNPNTLKDIDGVSLASYMAGRKPEPDFLNRCLYFHFPHYRSAVPHSAIVSGVQKVIHFYENPEIPMLFDLAGDEGEVRNIARDNPEQHKTLCNQMMRYFEQVGGRTPKVNPDYDPAKRPEDPKDDHRKLWGAFKGTRPLESDEK